jgi:hypothetical protein
MSADMYPICVEWDGPIGKDRPGRGFAKVGVITVVLLDPPTALPPMQEVHFSPTIHWFEVRERSVDPIRTMSQAEITNVYAWLNGIIDAVRYAMLGPK